MIFDLQPHMHIQGVAKCRTFFDFSPFSLYVMGYFGNDLAVRETDMPLARSFS